MADPTTINSMYPLEYFQLPTTTRIKYPGQYWWSSKSRFARIANDDESRHVKQANGGERTAEYLEIDLGRLREINYLNFQIMRVPVDITIQYDAVSADDGSHEWRAVQPVDDMPFDDTVHFDANSKNAWFNAQFYLANHKGAMVITRFLRLRFLRRDIDWPTSKTAPFRYPISVKELRTARYVSSLKDTIGPLINTGAGDFEQALDVDAIDDSTFEVRQQFKLPDDYLRGTTEPGLMGFSFEAQVNATGTQGQAGAVVTSIDDVKWAWNLYDSTDGSNPRLLRNGVVTGAANNNRAWIDVFFDPSDPVEPEIGRTYEVRLRSLDASLSSSVYLVTYLTSSPMPGGAAVVKFESDGSSGPVASKCLAFRLWGDVADEGTDVLGNQYRYATQREESTNVFDSQQVGWTCEPQPSPEAVEALYFDVRKPDPTNASRFITTVIDAVQVAPRTHGLNMHIYYTDTGLDKDKPHDRDSWDNMMWTPVNVTYTLRANQIYELPLPIRASFIKLEFSRLQPLPFRLPTYPKLPAREYRRYPSWVEEQFQNTQFRRTVNDWFINHLTPARHKALKRIADPIREFQYKEREFLVALSAGKVGKKFANDLFVDLKNRVLIDPVTGSKLFLDDGSLYKGSLTVNVDRGSVLGQLVADRFDPTVPTDPVEAEVNSNASKVPHVSTPNDRVAEAFAFLASTPMWFNRRCRHHYRIERASFNKQAFFASIRQVGFFRKDYTTRRDDKLIFDSLHDDHNLDFNTFEFDTPSAIWKALPPYVPNATPALELFVTYTVDDFTVEDEQIEFRTPAPPTGSNTPRVQDVEPVHLSQTGAPASNITVASDTGGRGMTFQHGVDYDITYDSDPLTGEIVNVITVSSLSSRLIASDQARIDDSDIVVGRAVITAIEEFIGKGPLADFSPAIGVAVITTAFEQFRGRDAATVTGVADIRQSNNSDAAVVTGIADQTAIANSFQQYIAVGGTTYNDSATATAAGVPTATFGYTDAAVATGIALVSGINVTQYADGAGQGVVAGGVSVFQGTAGSNAVDTSQVASIYPDASLISAYMQWSALQPNGPNDISGWNTVTTNGNTIDQSIDDANTNGYQIILRIGAGVDAPSWLFNTAVVGTPAVSGLSLIASDLTLGAVTVPVPWDAKLLTNYQNMLTQLAVKLHPTNASGLTAAGTRRCNVIYCLPTTLPMEAKPEMDISYGVPTTYTGGATLAATINSTATTITLGGTLTGYPTANFLLKINNELIFCLTRSSGTVTVASNGRGFTGSVAAGHNSGAIVQWASAGVWPAAGTGIYKGVTGVFDPVSANQAEWVSGGRTLATNETNLVTAWGAAIDAVTASITLGSATATAFGAGEIFGDNYANSTTVVDAKASPDVFVYTNNLQPGRDGSNNPTKVNNTTTYLSYYEGFDPDAATPINHAAGILNVTIGFRLAPKVVFDAFANPYSGSASALRVLLEDTITHWNVSFIEVTPDVVSTNPGVDSTYNYLF